MTPGDIVGAYALIEADDEHQRLWLAQSPDGRLVHIDFDVGDHLAFGETEAQSVKALKHPNLVRFLEANVHDGQPYVVTEFVEGLRLPRLVEGVYELGKIVPPWCVAYIVRGAAEALRFLDSVDVSLSPSRPLRPDHILVTRTGGVKLAAPGGVRAKPDDRPHSLFDLGVIGWELLSNRSLPATIREATTLHKEDVPALPPHIPDALAAVTVRCLARGAADRIAGYDELLGLLTEGLEQQADAPVEQMRRLVAQAGSGLGRRPVPTARFDKSQRPPSTNANLVAHPRFEVLERLGSGGMGAVYRVRDRELDEVVALKVLPATKEEQWRSLDRLRREARLARRISSDHVCRIFDIVDLGSGARGMTMALIDGVTLFDLMKTGMALSYQRFVRWGADVADGLDAAHRLAIVHRDLKPENIMIRREDDRAVILDFGIARMQSEMDVDSRLTQRGVVVGTPLYMSPEQLCNGELDGRSDLYALGLILTQLITGKVPHATNEFGELVRRRALDEESSDIDIREQSPQIPGSLASIINRMLAQAPKDRPESAAHVRDALLAIDASALSAASAPASYAMGELQPDLRPDAQTASDWRGHPGPSQRRSSGGGRAPGPGGLGWLLASIAGLVIVVGVAVVVVAVQRRAGPNDDDPPTVRTLEVVGGAPVEAVAVDAGFLERAVSPADAGDRRAATPRARPARSRRRTSEPLPEPEEM